MDKEQAEQEVKETNESQDQRVLWDNDVPLTPEFYANMAYVDETAAEVTMLFGSFFKEDGTNTHQVCKARIVMSHQSFFDFAERIAKEALFLRRLYGVTELPTIANVTDAEWQSAYEGVYGSEQNK